MWCYICGENPQKNRVLMRKKIQHSKCYILNRNFAPRVCLFHVPILRMYHHYCLPKKYNIKSHINHCNDFLLLAALLQSIKVTPNFFTNFVCSLAKYCASLCSKILLQQVEKMMRTCWRLIAHKTLSEFLVASAIQKEFFNLCSINVKVTTTLL